MSTKKILFQLIPSLMSVTLASSLIAQDINNTNIQNSHENKNTTQRFISDGSTLNFSNLEFSITPPAGWEVLTNYNNLSLVIREPEVQTIDKNETTNKTNLKPQQSKNLPAVEPKVKYQKNITVAVIHHPSYIDKKRAEELINELTKTFKEGSLVKNYNILEYKFFDFQEKQDGILVYATFEINDIKMMQMHILVSGANKQYLLTYTDLAETFSNPEFFNAAWNTMVSIKVNGKPPKRYQNLMYYGGISGFVLVLLAILIRIRNRQTRYAYLNEADVIYKDDTEIMNTSIFPETQTDLWVLTNKTKHQKNTKYNDQEEFVIKDTEDKEHSSNLSAISFISSF